MRIVVMGTGPFAVPTCQQLLADGHQIPLVVTRPVADPKAKKLPPRPVFDWAKQAGIQIFEPPSINTPESVSNVASHSPDLLFVCDYGQILSNACLEAARLGGINLHGSVLPRHRGAAPVQWCLLRGDAFAGVTVIHMTPRMDAGPAIAVAKTEIEEDETAETLEPRLAKLGVEATQQAIQKLSDWDGQTPLGEVQDKSLVTKAPRFAKADGQLDFRLPAAYLVRLVRACQPWPGTYAELSWERGKQMRLIVRAARAVDPQSLAGLSESAAGRATELAHMPPGTVASLTAEEAGQAAAAPWLRMLAVSTPAGLFLVGRLQPAGKREMDADEFLRGHPLDPSREPARFLLPEVPKAKLCD